MNKDSQKEKNVSIRVTGAKLIAIFVIAALWGGSIWSVLYFANKKSANQGEAEVAKLYPLLNPRLRNLSKEERASRTFATLIPLRDKLFDFLGDKKESAAFYVEDLNAGAWVGWQEKEPFVGASLLKVPIAIAVMKKIDQGEWTLDKTFPVEAADRDQFFGDLWQKEDGTMISIKELLDKMLQDSDNTASNILFNKLAPEERDEVFYYIGLTNPEKDRGGADSESPYYRLTPRNLATLFRALYNATYITRESSNYILQVLTETKFNGIVSSGEGKEMKVAHKIAAFSDPAHQEAEEYHDCGIAFFPDHPYLYCLMTQKMDAKGSQKAILGMTKIIYEFYSSGGKK